MQLGLEGKRALVTGGSSGIGLATAHALAEEGCSVAVVDRQPPPAGVLDELSKGGRRAEFLAADVRDADQAHSTVAKVHEMLGGLDILVCSAGITSDATVWKMTDAQWDDVVDVNLKGTFNYNRAAASLFMEQKAGKIVNISSINGLRGKFGQANYSASKGGVIGLSKTLARELGKFGINVNVVAPGMVLTEMMRGLPPDVIEKAVDETALGRLATPGDCAAAVVFLCSEPARHITGEVMQVDGGQYL